MNDLQSLSYHVDVVLVIDLTGSMGHVIKEVKAAALTFQEQLASRMTSKGKSVAQLRVRVVGFRDIFADQESLVESDFFSLPQEKEGFGNFVNLLKAKGGGGDGPESGLEGLSLAIHSKWTSGGDRQRHVIVVWSDARTHKLEKSQDQKPIGFGDRICSTFDALTDEWEFGQKSGIGRAACRLVLFAPDAYPWAVIGDSWTQTVWLPSQAGKGLREFEMDTLLNALVNSI